ADPGVGEHREASNEPVRRNRTAAGLHLYYLGPRPVDARDGQQADREEPEPDDEPRRAAHAGSPGGEPGRLTATEPGPPALDATEPVVGIDDVRHGSPSA